MDCSSIDDFTEGGDLRTTMAIGISYFHAALGDYRKHDIARKIFFLIAILLISVASTAYATSANSPDTEGTGIGATANVPGNISFSVPTKTVLGVDSKSIASGGSQFISPSNWQTINTGDYPVSITDVTSSNETANLKTTSIGTHSNEKLIAANKNDSDILNWNYNGGFNNKTYSQAGGQLLIPSRQAVTWTWYGGLTVANMSDDFRLDLANGLAKLCDVTFTYRAIVPLQGTTEITRYENGLDCSLTNTNSGGVPQYSWYSVDRNGNETLLNNSSGSSIEIDNLSGKTLICKISDPSYWTTGTITSNPYYIPDKFAVYSDDDNSLIFYDRGGVPAVGDTFNGRKVTAIYTGLTSDNLSFDSQSSQPWADERAKIQTVSFADEYTPTSTGHWFEGFTNLQSIDLTNLDFGKATVSASMFDGCSSLTDINAEKLDTASLANAINMFRGCSSLTSLAVDDWNVSHLWNTGSMFQNCTSLKSLDLSKWDTSGFVISYSMFQNDTKLETVGDTTNWNLSSVTNPTYMFTGCTSLKNLNTQNWSMKSARDLQFIFDDCFVLENVDVSKWNISNATNLEWLFNKCYKMTSIDVSDWDTSNVTSMQGTFANTTNLSNLDISKWDVSNVIDLSYMFNNAASLKSIAVDKWNVTKNKTLELTFMGCTSLTTLDISKWKIDNCTSLDYTFGECPNLDTIDISNWNVTNNEIFYRTFYLDKALKVLDISKWTNSIATNWIDFAKGCENVKELDVSGIDNSNAGECGYCGGVFIDMHRLEKITFGTGYRFTTRDAWPSEPDPTYIDGADGKWYAESTGIGYEHEKIPANTAETYYSSKTNANVPKAFAIYSSDDGSLNFYKRTSIPLKGSLFNEKTATDVYKNIDAQQDYEEATWTKQHASDIKSCTVVDDNIQPQSCYKWFYGATSMIKCDISKLDTSHTSNMSCMFTSCTSLSSLNISQLDTSFVSDISDMFSNCSEIVTLNISNWNVSNVINMGGMFLNCKKLTSIGNLTNWDISNVTNMSNMFNSCSSLILDCSNWKATKASNNHKDFNILSPNVISPSCWSN